MFSFLYKDQTLLASNPEGEVPQKIKVYYALIIIVRFSTEVSDFPQPEK
jgi:hypothetical protein